VTKEYGISRSPLRIRFARYVSTGRAQKADDPPPNFGVSLSAMTAGEFAKRYSDVDADQRRDEMMARLRELLGEAKASAAPLAWLKIGIEIGIDGRERSETKWQKQPHEAEQELTLIVPFRTLMPGEIAPRLTRLEGLLAADAGRTADALAKLQEAEGGMLAALGPKDARSFLIRLDRAELLHAGGHRAAAAALARQVEDNVRTRLVPASPLFLRIRRLE
jgi:hypothetical protein